MHLPIRLVKQIKYEQAIWGLIQIKQARGARSLDRHYLFKD